jgi:hypothetical protein
MLRFYSDSGLASMTLTLTKQDGLYYTHTDVFKVDRDPLCHVALKANRLATLTPPKTRATHHQYTPVSKTAHTEAELWMVRLGSPGEDQLDMLPGNVTRIPSEFHYHPFRFIDFKEQARIRKTGCSTHSSPHQRRGQEILYLLWIYESVQFGLQEAESKD